MPDLYLQALMHGEILKKSLATSISSEEKKNRFEVATEKAIDDHIETLTFDEDNPVGNKLVTPEMQRSRVKAELKEKAKLPELSAFIESAFKILTSEGGNYLDKDHTESMNKDFASGLDVLQKIDLNSPASENFQALLHFSDSTMDSIFKIALEKFNELQYSDSLSLFILLTTLNPENPDYWYRAGILAQKCENYELATRLFSAATDIDPVLIGPRVFLIDCYLKREMISEAKVAYAEAMEINEVAQIEDSWKEMLSIYDALLNKS
jgi:tetratricopeptide (TPR) repeat protein